MIYLKALTTVFVCLASIPFFVIGMLAGIVGFFMMCGWHWGVYAMESIFEADKWHTWKIRWPWDEDRQNHD